jgi:microcystin-dependent protein
MNKANYTNRVQRKFPLSTEGLDFIQLQIMLAAEYASSAGGNYILSGCAVSGGRAASGIMVINGEILTFTGGDLQDKVRIVELAESITAEGSNYPDSYIRRHVEFGQNLGGADTFNWSDIVPFPTNKFLLDNSATKEELEELKTLAMPKGAIIMWSGSTTQLPAGFALCNGQNVADYGVVPDLRGRFVVGFDASKSNIPENNTTTTENYGKIGNRGGLREVALSTAQMPSHSHNVRDYYYPEQTTGGISGSEYVGGNQIGSGDTDRDNNYLLYKNHNTDAAGGSQAHENRPPYYVLAFIIKVI